MVVINHHCVKNLMLAWIHAHEELNPKSINKPFTKGD